MVFAWVQWAGGGEKSIQITVLLGCFTLRAGGETSPTAKNA